MNDNHLISITGTHDTRFADVILFSFNLNGFALYGKKISITVAMRLHPARSKACKDGLFDHQIRA